MKTRDLRAVIDMFFVVMYLAMGIFLVFFADTPQFKPALIKSAGIIIIIYGLFRACRCIKNFPINNMQNE